MLELEQHLVRFLAERPLTLRALLLRANVLEDLRTQAACAVLQRIVNETGVQARVSWTDEGITIEGAGIRHHAARPDPLWGETVERDLRRRARGTE
jgi:hypothetical protein